MAAKTETKKPGLFKRLGEFFKKSWSELKKVSWPTFRTVMKNTCIVILIVAFFSVVIYGFDTFVSWLIKLKG